MWRIEILLVLLQSLVATGNDDYEDFLICRARADVETLDCGPGGVIDILQAWVASVSYQPWSVNKPCRDEYDWRGDLNIKTRCRKDLAFLSCHGKQSCVVNGSLAQVWLPECWKDLITKGLNSDVLYVRYRCHQLNNSTTVMLPSPDDVTSNPFDVTNPGFPEVTKKHYNISCLITPSEYTDDEIRIDVIAKVTYVEPTPTSQCVESLDVSLSGERMMCRRGTYQEYRNHAIEVHSDGRQWTLEYRSDGTIKHKFWFQITATKVGTNDPVEMVISCVDNLALPPTHDAMGKSQDYKTGDKQTGSVIVGSVLGVLLLIVLILLIVTCRKKYERKHQSTAAPSGVTSAESASGEFNGGGPISGYINTSVITGTPESYENLPRTYTSILETDGNTNNNTDDGRLHNDDSTNYEYIKVDDNRNRFNEVGTNGDAKYEDVYTDTMETKNDKYEDLLTATRDTNKPEPYEELSIVTK